MHYYLLKYGEMQRVRFKRRRKVEELFISSNNLTGNIFFFLRQTEHAVSYSFFVRATFSLNAIQVPEKILISMSL